MKYVRTRDGIEKIETIADIQTKVISKDYYVDEADNIEDLCDEFVVLVEKDSKGVILGHKATLPWAKEIVKLAGLTSDEYEIRGAIWTDKGLLYVAKMNEKGGWELL